MSADPKDAPATDPSKNVPSSHAAEPGKTEGKGEEAIEPAQATTAERRKIVLISSGDPMQDSRFQHFRQGVDADVAVFRSVDDWIRRDDVAAYSLIVLHAAGDHLGRELATLGQIPESSGGRPPFVVLADSERQADVIASIKRGARGFIPTSASLDFMIDVIKFVFVGGVYCPPCAGQGSR